MRRYMVLLVAVSGIFLGFVVNGWADDKNRITVFLDKAPLAVGDPAPKLTVQEFLRGEPVKHFEKGKIYVVEFWHYSCPSCRGAVPHLTALQKQYPDIIFVSVGVITPASIIKKYVREMGDKMGYRVAVDAVPANKGPRTGAMVQSWLEPAGKLGFPTTFIIDGNGKIAWIGNPMAMDDPLAKIRSGKWNVPTARSREKEQQRRNNGITDTTLRGNEARRWVAQLPEAECAAVQAIQKLVGRVRLGSHRDKTVTQMCINSTEATDAVLKELEHLKELQHLNLARTQVTDEGLKELKNLKELQHLNLAKTQVTDAGLKELKTLKKLRILKLDGTRVRGEGLRELQGLRDLEGLGLDATQVTDATFKYINILKYLQQLSLNDTSVTDAGLKDLKDWTKLRMLCLEGTRITDAGLKDLKELKGIRSLLLARTRVTDVGLKELHGLKKLWLLSLNGTQVTDVGLRELKQFQGLQDLILDDTKVTDAGLRELKHVSGLLILSLNNTQVTDAGLKELRGMKGLKSLELSGTKVTKTAMDDLKKSLPRVYIVR